MRWFKQEWEAEMPPADQSRAMRVATGTHCLYCNAPLMDGGHWYFEIAHAWSPVPLTPGREAFEYLLCDVCNGLPDEERIRRLPPLLVGRLGSKITAQERAQFARLLRKMTGEADEEDG